MPPKAADPPDLLFDRMATLVAAVVVLALVVFLEVRNQPFADVKLYLVLRVVLSLCVASLGATIPGFLNIRWSGRGLAIRAGGALALFVLTYVVTPDAPKQDPAAGGITISAPGGVAAQSITGSPITVTPPQAVAK